MTTQKEYIEQVLDFKNKNPEMEIKLCVNSDEISDGNWTSHVIWKVEICKWYNGQDGRFYLGEEEIFERLEEEFYDGKATEEEIRKLVRGKYDKEAKSVICIFTEAS